MLKILHVIPNLRKGGAERIVIDICRELGKRNNVCVKLLCFSAENNYKFLSENIDITYSKASVVPSLTGKTFVETADFDKLVNEFKPDIIHSHLFEAEIVTRWNTFQGVKYFSHGHDKMKQFKNLSILTFFHKNLITNYYEKKLLVSRYKKCNNKLIAISKDTEEYYKTVFPKKLKKGVFLLHNAIDFNRFKSDTFQIKEVSKTTVNLISIGSLIEIKNHLFLIDVLQVLKSKNPGKYKLTIIGEGILRNVLEKKISDKGLNNTVFLPGIIDNVEDHLKKSDIYIYSCKNEGFGLTMIEAMAGGLPVICLDGKGNRDIIENGKNGFMIYENNPEVFAEKIIELSQNKELYSSMSKYAVEFAKKYDIKDYVDKLLAIYNHS